MAPLWKNSQASAPANNQNTGPFDIWQPIKFQIQHETKSASSFELAQFAARGNLMLMGIVMMIICAILTLLNCIKWRPKGIAASSQVNPFAELAGFRRMFSSSISPNSKAAGNSILELASGLERTWSKGDEIATTLGLDEPAGEQVTSSGEPLIESSASALQSDDALAARKTVPSDSDDTIIHQQPSAANDNGPTSAPIARVQPVRYQLDNQLDKGGGGGAEPQQVATSKPPGRPGGVRRSASDLMATPISGQIGLTPVRSAPSLFDLLRCESLDRLSGLESDKWLEIDSSVGEAKSSELEAHSSKCMPSSEDKDGDKVEISNSSEPLRRESQVPAMEKQQLTNETNSQAINYRRLSSSNADKLEGCLLNNVELDHYALGGGADSPPPARKYFVYLVNEHGMFGPKKDCIAQIELDQDKRVTLSELRQIIVNSQNVTLASLKRSRFKFVTETYRLLNENEDAAMLNQFYPAEGVFVKLNPTDSQPDQQRVAPSTTASRSRQLSLASSSNSANVLPKIELTDEKLKLKTKMEPARAGAGRKSSDLARSGAAKRSPIKAVEKGPNSRGKRAAGVKSKQQENVETNRPRRSKSVQGAKK